jgi:hypothetical protein
MKNKSLFFSAFLLLFTGSLNAQDRTNDSDEARSIFEEMDERRSSVETETAIMQMVITDPRGRTRSRTLQSWTEHFGDDTRSLIVFSEPGNVRGTAFLSISEDGSQTQQLYLPSVGRIQTISSAERSDRFMGSDFTYEDLGDQNPDDYEFEWLESGDAHYTIRASKPDSDQYSRLEFVIEKERYTLETIRYFDESDKEIKRLEAENFEQVNDRLHSPRMMTMYDLREDRKTVISWSERNINTPIEEWRFTERGMQRGI